MFTTEQHLEAIHRAQRFAREAFERGLTARPLLLAFGANGGMQAMEVEAYNGCPQVAAQLANSTMVSLAGTGCQAVAAVYTADMVAGIAKHPGGSIAFLKQWGDKVGEHPDAKRVLVVAYNSRRGDVISFAPVGESTQLGPWQADPDPRPVGRYLRVFEQAARRAAILN